MTDTDMDFDILDQTIDELADYVPFEPFPVGDYRCQFTYEFITVGNDDLPAIRATFTLLEVLKIAQAGAEAPEEGRKISPPLYILRKKDGERNTMAEGFLKRDLIAPFSEALGGDKVSEILANADGCPVIVTFGVRKRKNKDTGDVYSENVIKALVVDA